MKNKILRIYNIIIGSLLSVLGISIGNIACAYGPPGNFEEVNRLKQFQEEVRDLERKVEDKKIDVLKIKVKVDAFKKDTEKLKTEKDSLEILLQKFDN